MSVLLNLCVFFVIGMDKSMFLSYHLGTSRVYKQAKANKRGCSEMYCTYM